MAFADLYTENIFATWMEEKVDINPYENISQVPVVAPSAAPAPLLVPAPGPQQTEELLREFENVYDTYTHLTPPQSPPGSAAQMLISYAQQAQCAPIQPVVAYPQPEWPRSDFVDIAAPQFLYLPVPQLDTPHISGSSDSASPQSSPPSSPRSSDDDWAVPTPRRKPYSRGSDDRHSRKKEQNKNAATRYRQKKKAEIEILLSEENTMRQRNADLGNKCSDLQREILLLKGLMRDLFKAKGLIK